MYYEPTMTPPPPKIIFPTADPEPPSTPHSSNHHNPTVQYHPNPSLSPSIIIQLTPSCDVEILTPNPVENPNPATPTHYTIQISIPTSSPVHTVENKSTSTIQHPHISIIQTPVSTVETDHHLQSPSNTIYSTPVPPTVETKLQHSPLSATASLFIPRQLYTPRRKRRPYKKYLASLTKGTHVITPPETHRPVEQLPSCLTLQSPPPSISIPNLETMIPNVPALPACPPDKSPSRESHIVETTIPALAVESLPPIRTSSPQKESVQQDISPALLKYFTTIFEYEIDEDFPAILLENEIFTMEDLSTLDYSTFPQWSTKTHYSEHQDIKYLLQWCIYYKKTIYDFHFDNLNEGNDYIKLRDIFDELQKHIVTQPSTSPPSSPRPQSPSSTKSDHHTHRHSSTYTTPTVITTLADDAPSHIRAIFDKCHFYNHQYSPPLSSYQSTSDTPNNDDLHPFDNTDYHPSDDADSHGHSDTELHSDDCDEYYHSTCHSPYTPTEYYNNHRSYHDESSNHRHHHSPTANTSFDHNSTAYIDTHPEQSLLQYDDYNNLEANDYNETASEHPHHSTDCTTTYPEESSYHYYESEDAGNELEESNEPPDDEYFDDGYHNG